jgi:probable HAF family extracellular repeat protein
MTSTHRSLGPRALSAAFAATLVALGLLASVHAQAASKVTVTDMGELSPGLGSEANAINNAGRTVGRAMSNTDFQYRQVIWDGLHLQEFSNCCSGFLPTVQSINLSGEVVAFYKATKVHWVPVYWTPQGTSFALPALGPYGFGKAYAINDAGQIAGSSVDANDDIHAVVWDRNAQLHDLGVMGEPAPEFKRFSEARDINASGVVVGQGLVGYDYHAFAYSNGSYTDLGLGAATHVNDSGLIAGYAPGFIPVTWTQGAKKNLPALGGGKIAYGHLVNALNNAGDLVGYAPAPGAGVFTIAVLWRGGKVINLGHYPGGNNSVATGINDQGQIVGSGNLVPGGPQHALRWTVKGKKVVVELG